MIFHIISLIGMDGGSAQFFSSLRSLQLLSYTSLVHIKYPTNIQVFNILVIKFANTDLLADQVGGFYENLGFRETPVFSSLFEQFEVGGLNLVLNSGSFFLFLAILVTKFVLAYFINLIAVYFRKYYYARKIGMMVYQPNRWNSFKELLSKLCLESVLDLIIMF